MFLKLVSVIDINYVVNYTPHNVTTDVSTLPNQETSGKLCQLVQTL